MSADFLAGYLSGALGIVIGNPLDVLKVRLQAGRNDAIKSAVVGSRGQPFAWINGAAAPIVGYGALNSLLFVSYNRSLKMMDPSIPDPTKLAGVKVSKIWVAGAIGGLASWTVSAPTELIKCRAQLAINSRTSSSYRILKNVWTSEGFKGLYLGGVVTSLRDSIGYGFYFSTYEICKRILLSRQADPFQDPTSMDVLVSGGIAGVMTWFSIYPLDVIKTRIQGRLALSEAEDLMTVRRKPHGIIGVTREVYSQEGAIAFYRGLGVCSVRAFIVNAVQVGRVGQITIAG